MWSTEDISSLKQVLNIDGMMDSINKIADSVKELVLARCVARTSGPTSLTSDLNSTFLQHQAQAQDLVGPGAQVQGQIQELVAPGAQESTWSQSLVGSGDSCHPPSPTPSSVDPPEEENNTDTDEDKLGSTLGNHMAIRKQDTDDGWEYAFKRTKEGTKICEDMALFATRACTTKPDKDFIKCLKEKHIQPVSTPYVTMPKFDKGLWQNIRKQG